MATIIRTRRRSHHKCQHVQTEEIRAVSSQPPRSLEVTVAAEASTFPACMDAVGKRLQLVSPWGRIICISA